SDALPRSPTIVVYTIVRLNDALPTGPCTDGAASRLGRQSTSGEQFAGERGAARAGSTDRAHWARALHDRSIRGREAGAGAQRAVMASVSCRSSTRLGASREGKGVEVALVVVLHVDLQARQHAHDRIVEADGDHQVDGALVVEAFPQLCEGRIRDGEIARHLG